MQRKGTLNRPNRSCTKRTGPGESIFTARAISAITGSVNNRQKPLTTISTTRLEAGVRSLAAITLQIRCMTSGSGVPPGARCSRLRNWDSVHILAPFNAKSTTA
jgi:hypothetical protein